MGLEMVPKPVSSFDKWYSLNRKGDNAQETLITFIVHREGGQGEALTSCKLVFCYFLGSFFLPPFPTPFQPFIPLTLDRRGGGRDKEKRIMLSLDYFLLIGGGEFLGASLMFAIRISNFFLLSSFFLPLPPP